MTAVEWLVENSGLKDNLLWQAVIEQAKKMDKDNCKKMYEHATFSILEHGHGETFDEYWNRNFKSK